MNKEEDAKAEPAVWVGCMGCYNENRLNGKWVAALDAEKVTIAQLHKNDRNYHGHEELWCFDKENIPIKGEISPTEATNWARAHYLTSVPEQHLS